MLTIADFFHLSYWFTPNPGTLGIQFTLFFATLFAVCILAKILLRYMGRQYTVHLPKFRRELFFRGERLALTMGIVGYLWLFFAYEMIPFFSSRFWMVIWMLALFLWVYSIFHYALYEIPQHFAKEREREYKKKYFGKRQR